MEEFKYCRKCKIRKVDDNSISYCETCFYESTPYFDFKPDQKTTKIKITEDESIDKTTTELVLLIKKKNLIIDALCEKLEKLI